MFDYVSKNTTVVGILVGVIGGLAVAVLAINAAMSAWSVVILLVNAAFWSSPIFWIIAGIVALVAVIVIIATKTTWFQQIWNAAFKAISDIVQSVWGWISKNWPLLLAILTGPIGLAVKFIVDHIDDITAAAKTVWSYLSGPLSTIWDTVKTAAVLALNIILAPINAITAAFNGVVGAVKSVIDWISKIKIPDLGSIASKLNPFAAALAPRRLHHVPAVVRGRRRRPRRPHHHRGRARGRDHDQHHRRDRPRLDRPTSTADPARRHPPPHRCPDRPVRMSTGTTATLYLAGTRFADGAPGDPETDPVAMSGLGVVWGRDTTVDQPAPSTCTFTVTDEAGGAGTRSFLGKFHTGVPVDVTATGTDYPDPTVSTFLDPGFESDPVAAAATNATVGASTRRVHGGARALKVDPVDGTRRWSVSLPPGQFVPAGTSPGAWDTIPQTAPGQTWHDGTGIYAPPGVYVTLRPVMYAGPWATAGRPVDTPTSHTGAGDWHYLTIPLTAETAGQWVGIEVSAYPTGPAWADIPHGVDVGAVVELLLTTVPNKDPGGGAGRTWANDVTAVVDCVVTGLRYWCAARANDGVTHHRDFVRPGHPSGAYCRDPGAATVRPARHIHITIPFSQPFPLSAGQTVVAGLYIPTVPGGLTGYRRPPNAVAGQVTSIAAGSRYGYSAAPAFPTATDVNGGGR